MKSDLVKMIYAYQMREDRRLWDEVIMQLDESLFDVDTGYSWGSLQRECAHVVDAMHGYMQRLRGSRQITKAFAIDNPDRARLRERWDEVEDQWKTYRARFDDREFGRLVEATYRDSLITVPAWQLVFQVFNHNTLHRAEILQIVAALRAPVDFDMSFARYCIRNAE